MTYAKTAGVFLREYNQLKQYGKTINCYKQFLNGIKDKYNSEQLRRTDQRLSIYANRKNKKLEEKQTKYRGGEHNTLHKADIELYQKKYRESHSPDYVREKFETLYCSRVRQNDTPYVKENYSVHYDSLSQCFILEGDFNDPENVDTQSRVELMNKDANREDVNSAVDEDENESEFVVHLQGSFYSRNQRLSRNIKKIRAIIAKRKVDRPPIRMNMLQYYWLKELYKGDVYKVIKNRSIYHKEENIDTILEYIIKKSFVCDRKVFMDVAGEFFSKTFSDSLYRRITGADFSDAATITFINNIEEKLNSKCHYRNVVIQDISPISRNNIVMKELVSITFVSYAAAELFKPNPHILFVDACHTSDYGTILLCVFLDGNHMVQPLAFQICSSENNHNWVKFFSALVDAGINYDDLVINSDRHKAIRTAIELVFHDNVEQTHCFVHVERNIQDAWSKEYGAFSEKEVLMVETFNSIMEDLNRARVAITEQECKLYLKRIKNTESAYNESDHTPIYDYIKAIDGIYMYQWKNEHLMQVTTNPVEICMKELKESRYGMKECRSESLLNRYRYLFRWIYERIEKRNKALKEHSRIPISSLSSIPTPYIEKYIIGMGHYYECYKGRFIVRDANQNRSIQTERLNLFLVEDMDYHTKYTVNVQNHSCTCHTPHWSKLPCIHIIAVLHERQQYCKVWEMIGEMYLIKNTSKTSRNLSFEENIVLEDVANQNRIIPLPENIIDVALRDMRGRSIKNKHRYESKGENIPSSFVF